MPRESRWRGRQRPCFGLQAGTLVALGLVRAVGGGWVDPDTEPSVMTSASLVDGRPFELVFSDEFNVPGRVFDDGSDTRWTAMHKDDYTNNALHFYNKSSVTTNDGFLNITTKPGKVVFDALDDDTMKYVKTRKNFESAMLQTWNKFCFTGGIVEVRGRLPGEGLIGGLWPAIWMMGNLARATYVGSSNWLWPWSYNACDRDLQKKQKISACDPRPHYGLEPNRGRGAPEIDLLEAMPGNEPLQGSPVGKPYFSTSLQVAPGVDDIRPEVGMAPWAESLWYNGLEYGPNSSQNIFFYGVRNAKRSEEYSYQADAVSGNTQLNDVLWGQTHTWRLEWDLGEDVDAPGDLRRPADDAHPYRTVADPTDDNSTVNERRYGYIKWYQDDALVFSIPGQALHDKMGSIIPSEPMYLILNTAISSTWGFPSPCPAGCDCKCYDCAPDASEECSCGFADGFCKSLPAHFLLDYVRVYQDANNTRHKVGCSTPERPTAKWIEGHVHDYKDRWDKQPLKPVVAGGFHCDGNWQCGADHDGGTCHRHECKCADGWTGPQCRASVGFDDIRWEVPQGLPLAAPYLPSMLALAAGLLVVFFCAANIMHAIQVRQTEVFGMSFAPPSAERTGLLPHEADGSGATDNSSREGDQTQGWPSGVDAGGASARRLTTTKTYSMAPVASEVQLSNMIGR